MKFLYLLVDFFTVLVPFIFSFHPKLKFHKHWRAFFTANILVTALFVLWDMAFTQIGVWGFNPEYVTGMYFYNLPIEEILFFICIPFSCTFTYHCLNLFFKLKWNQKSENYFIIFVAILLLLTGIYYHNKFYTFYTFISLGIILPVIKFFFRVNWIGKLLSVYPVLLIPFFCVNGILTGSGLKEPVVWYNNAHNLQIRLLTIPIEDVFYGFELILLNIFFYELLKIKQNEPAKQ